VALEQPERLLVDRLQVAIFEFDPDAEVNDGVEVETNNLVVVPGLQECLLILFDKVLEGWPDRRPSANRHAGVMHRIPLPRGAIARGGNYPKKSTTSSTPIGLKSRAFLPTPSRNSG
jgi:hypothetical protein